MVERERVAVFHARLGSVPYATTREVADVDNGYPPYNIEAVGDEHYRVTLAVAGFSRDEPDLQVREDTLHVAGRQTDEAVEPNFLHQGIAGRSFQKQFGLADHVQVENAWLDNGLLTIDLVREIPEEMKPRSIAIATSAPKTIVSKAKKLLTGENTAA